MCLVKWKRELKKSNIQLFLHLTRRMILLLVQLTCVQRSHHFKISTRQFSACPVRCVTDVPAFIFAVSAQNKQIATFQKTKVVTGEDFPIFIPRDLCIRRRRRTSQNGALCFCNRFIAWRLAKSWRS